MNTAEKLISISSALTKELVRLKIPSIYIYNPTDYAATCWHTYLRRFADTNKKTVFIGMNPGPWGMTQTGIPFGEIQYVRHWLGIEGQVNKPKEEHPAKPVLGFACQRREISGKRFWGLVEQEFKTADAFFKKHLVLSYCPLTFISNTKLGKNITPLQLQKSTRDVLYQACDHALAKMLGVIQPVNVIGIGHFATSRLKHIQKHHAVLSAINIFQILHPSPASPAANKNWTQDVLHSLQQIGIW